MKILCTGLVEKTAGNSDSGILALSLGIREMATLLAASTPLAAKLASAEKHMATFLCSVSDGSTMYGREFSWLWPVSSYCIPRSPMAHRPTGQFGHWPGG